MKDLELIKKELNEATGMQDGLLATGLDKDIVHLYFEATALYIQELISAGNQEDSDISCIRSESDKQPETTIGNNAKFPQQGTWLKRTAVCQHCNRNIQSAKMVFCSLECSRSFMRQTET